MTHFDAWRLFIATMQRLLPLTLKLGVKLLIQPGPEMLIAGGDDTLKFLKELEFPPQMQIDFNAGSFFCIGEDPCEAWKKLESHIGHVSLGDIPANREHRHIQLGEGIMDVPRFLECVNESEYDGYVTISIESYDQKAEDIVMASAQYLINKGLMQAK